jgi:hypothetical protein
LGASAKKIIGNYVTQFYFVAIAKHFVAFNNRCFLIASLFLFSVQFSQLFHVLRRCNARFCIEMNHSFPKTRP